MINRLQETNQPVAVQETLSPSMSWAVSFATHGMKR
jgi:hypothetical protein